MPIHDHPIEVAQLAIAVVGTACAASLLYVADKARRVYKASGENDPEMVATAAANLRDECLRLSKHLLIVVIGVMTLVMETPGQALTDREEIVRWVLIMMSALMMAQSFMGWRDRVASEKRGIRRDRRQSDVSVPEGRRRNDR